MFSTGETWEMCKHFCVSCSRMNLVRNKSQESPHLTVNLDVSIMNFYTLFSLPALSCYMRAVAKKDKGVPAEFFSLGCSLLRLLHDPIFAQHLNWLYSIEEYEALKSQDGRSRRPLQAGQSPVKAEGVLHTGDFQS